MPQFDGRLATTPLRRVRHRAARRADWHTTLLRLLLYECDRLVERGADVARARHRLDDEFALSRKRNPVELLALEWDDVDLIAGRLVVPHAVARGIIGTPKNGRTREIALSKEALAALNAHRHLRGSLVFCNADGKLLTKEGCKWPLWRACKRGGLRRMGWHALLHRYSHLSPDVRRDAVPLLDRRCNAVAMAEGEPSNLVG